MAKGDQVLRFGVGVPDGARSGTWRLWVQQGRSDVYLSRRSLGSSFKVSLHAGGPWRVALTREYVQRPDRNIVLGGPDPRGAIEWDRPAPQAGSAPATHAFNIVVPWWEVCDRPGVEEGEVVWAEPPPEGSCVEYAVIYVPPEMRLTNHPGARSMNAKLVGEVALANGDRVFVVWTTHAMEDELRAAAERLRSTRFVTEDRTRIEGLSLLGFGVENGVGSFIDVAVNTET
jgi:hypothetical protein